MIKKICLVIIFSISFHSMAKTPDLIKNILSPPYLIDLEELNENVNKIKSGVEPFNSYGEHIIHTADKLLDSTCFTITNKKYLPPSGNKNDYYSLGPYWWPDSSKIDGKPYVRRDGHRNPETLKYDAPLLKKMVDAIEVLTIAYIVTNDKLYKNKAFDFLHTWFINEKTRMNPNLEFGQAIPGIVDGRGIGIIETLKLVDLVDLLGILYRMEAIGDSDYQIIQQWFADYNFWLNTSKKGIDEKNWYNNHGTAYDLQVISFSLFTGNNMLAENVLDSVSTKRINNQITPQGLQPFELERTKSLSYSILNIKILFKISFIAEKLKLDLWQYESEDGRSIAKAVNFLIPYLFEGEIWPYQEMKPLHELRNDFIEIFGLAKKSYNYYNFEKYLRYYCENNMQLMRERLLRLN